jgi:hypothetical protein
MDSDKIKHLEFIQSVITRLNSNSFQIKSWAITIVAGVLVLFATMQKQDFIIVGIFSLILFWFMDGYCLSQERKFRGLYNDVAGIAENPKNLKPFEMNTNLYKSGYYSFRKTLWAKTIWLVYLPVIVLLLVLYLIKN